MLSMYVLALHRMKGLFLDSDIMKEEGDGGLRVNRLTVHFSVGNTGRGRTMARLYPAHEPLFSDVVTAPECPGEGSLQHRTSQCCQRKTNGGLPHVLQQENSML